MSLWRYSISEYLAIGKLTKPFGINGAIKVKSFSGEFDHFFQLGGEFVKLYQSETSTNISVQVRSVISKGKVLLVFFEGFDTPEGVSSLSGLEIIVSREFSAFLKPGEFYLVDLVGCKLTFREVCIGEVVGYFETCHIVLNVLVNNGSYVLIPFNEFFVGEVDLKEKSVQLLDDGLL